MVGNGGSSAGSYLADPTYPIPSHCASIVMTSTLRVKVFHNNKFILKDKDKDKDKDTFIGPQEFVVHMTI